MTVDKWKDKLLATFEERQIGRFQRMLSEIKNVATIEETQIMKNICHAPNSAQFLKACLDAGCSPQTVYEGKYVVHFAAECLNVQNLKILLKSDPTLANQTDSESQTPLHIVVNALTADNQEVVFEAIKLLIQHDADVNLAVQSTKVDTPFNLLVEKLQNVPQKRKRQDILDFIHDNALFIDMHTPKRGDIEQLLSVYHPKLLKRLASNCYEGRNTKQVIDTLLDHMYVDEKQMIQDLYALKVNPKFENIVLEVFNDGGLLEEVIKRGMTNSVRMLIKLGADPFRTYPAPRQPAIMVACFYGNPNVVQVILESRATFDCAGYPEPLLHHTIKHFQKKGFYEPDTNHYKVFDLLINNPNIDVNEQDQDRHSALYYAGRKNDKVSIRKLLRKHAFIGSMCELNTIMPFDSIDPELLEQYFDTCIAPTNKSANPGDDGYELSFNFTCFKPPNLRGYGALNELTTINYIASRKKFQHLMTHPLITSFLFLKWYPLSPIFYLNLLVYALICLMMVAYVVFMYGTWTPANHFTWVPFGFAAIIMLRELGQFVFAPKRYLTSVANYVELLLVGLSWLVFCDKTCLKDDSARRGVGALVILLAVMELLFLIGTLPIFSLSTYMIMLKKVTMTFLRILCLYLLILGAFACAFVKLFDKNDLGASDDQPKIKNLALWSLKTIVMFTGEFDVSGFDFSGNYWMGYTLFIIFLFFISIIMMNLLSGLAVSDTQSIWTKASLIDWVERAKLLTRYEQTMMNMRLLANLVPDVLQTNTVKIRITHFANGSVVLPMIVRQKVDTANEAMSHLRLRRLFNWFLAKLLIFDYDIVKQGVAVMESCACREQEQKQRKKEEKRMEGIEQTLNEVLQLLKAENRGKKVYGMLDS